MVSKDVKLNFGIKACTLPGGYNPITKRISFNDDGNITSETLKEELFHAWQDAYYFDGKWQYRETGKVNIEFEAKLFKDIISPDGSGCCYTIYENLGGISEEELVEIREELNVLRDFIFDVREFNTIDFSRIDYTYYLDLFNKYNKDYSSPKSSNLNNPNALINLISISNCFK